MTLAAILEHLPALQVVIPLIAAPLCVFIARPGATWMVATLVSWVVFIISIALLDQVMSGGVIRYEMGGWAAPWGIEYRIDFVNAFVLVIVSGISAITVITARASVQSEVRSEKVYLLYTAWMLCLTGLLGITITGDAFNVFVFLEISSLSTYILISLGRERKAFVAAFRYLIMGTVGATFILIGVGLLYGMTGTLNMADLADRLPAVGSSDTVQAAYAFILVGVALKLALFPLHMWLPNAYAYAPSVVTAFLAGSATKVAVYVMLRFMFTVYGAAYSYDTMHLTEVVLPLALAGIVIASAVAIFQDDVKRLLAYSSVAQIGYVALGVSFGTVNGLTAGIIHLFNHALTKGALFIVVACVVFRVGSASVNAFAGLGRRMPWSIGLFVLSSLSLVGVPLTAGFTSKWYLLSGALERGWWPVALLVVLASLMAVIYTGKVIESAYFNEPPEASLQAQAREAPLELLGPGLVLGAAIIYFGANAEWSAGVAGMAAEALLGTRP